MIVTSNKVTQLTITEAPNLDPIRVVLEDIAPSKGRIIIECYGKSWSSYWGGMSGRTISQFFRSCSDDYLIPNLQSGLSSRVYSADTAANHMIKQVLKRRRKRDCEQLSKDAARDIYDDIDIATFYDDPWGNHELYRRVFGEEWYLSDLPQAPNPEYKYLQCIIEAVQEGLRIHEESEAKS